LRGLQAIAIGTALLASSSAGAGLRDELLAVPLSPRLGGDTTLAIVTDKAFTFPAANLRLEHQRPFFFGNRVFNTNWTIAPGSVASFDGLGPTYNRVSCSGCHTRDGRGHPPADGTGPLDSMLFRLGVRLADGSVATVHPDYGDQLNERAVPGVPAEGVARIAWTEVTGRYADGAPWSLLRPSYTIEAASFSALDDVLISPRVAPAVIGLGLLEAVPEATLEALADPDDRDGDGISGRLNRVWSDSAARILPGRFGWKANVATLVDQNAGAALGDIGLTSPLRAEPNCPPAQRACLATASHDADPDLAPSFLERLTLYTRLLAVPAQRDPDDPMVQRGEALFREVGCAACHLPTLRTGPAALPELAQQTFHPFTDLLLHDLGEDLADGRPDGLATGREWRTAPLWGLGLVGRVNGHDRLLHDGRARGFAEAILWHGGEARAARDAFAGLDRVDRDALVAFLASL
jgi:CxxC motif-containing protein (DUF1111 family)